MAVKSIDRYYII